MSSARNHSGMTQIDERMVSVMQQGENLRAIETSLKGESGTKPVIVFLPSGLKYSAGPYRIFVNFARQLAEDGFLCYRFDPRGIGFSDGEFGGEPIHQLWNRVETGCFVEDLACFITWLRESWPRRDIVLCGLCGGAITAALLSCRHDDLVDGIISINTEVFHSRMEALSSEADTATHVNSVMKKYATKIFSRNAWSRLLSLESDVKGILRVTGKFMLQTFRSRKRELSDYQNINHHLVSAFRNIGDKGISHLMLFSQHSSSWHKFQDTFLPTLLESRYSSRYGELKIIGDATHELHACEHRAEALGQIKNWLNSTFASSTSPTEETLSAASSK